MLVEEQMMTQTDVVELYEQNRSEINDKAAEVIKIPRLNSAAEIMNSLIPPKMSSSLSDRYIDEQKRKVIFAGAYHQLSQKRNLSQLINFALTDLMITYPNMVVFGEDVGKKGGVYRVTADLQARFGKRRVFDTLLDETTILGTAIGFAHNGFIPVPEIQFLAYLHNAEDQLRGEAATLSFFSNGQYQNPMVIRIAALAYQKGFGGHFHNDNSIAVLRDLPGVIVVCPSNGEDAVKLLRCCLKLADEGRICIFLEPIALYMTKDLHVTGDNRWLFSYPLLGEEIILGEVGIWGEGDLVIITYANGYYLSRQAALILLEKHNLSVKIIDLRWLSPLPKSAILKETQDAKKILIVDEGRKSASISEGLCTFLMEELHPLPLVKRLTGEDCFIPLGTSWQYLLPSRETIIDAVLELNSANRRTNNG